MLIAKGFVNGKSVAEDIVQLHHLPTAPAWSAQKQQTKNLVVNSPQKHYCIVSIVGAIPIQTKTNLYG
jgi:hypothetical protein